MKRTNIHLPDAVRERLKALAAASDMTVAQIVRTAIKEYLSRNKVKP